MAVRPKVESSRGAAIDFAAEIEKTIRLSRTASAEPAPAVPRAADVANEWSDTLDLVVQATDMIGAAQLRIVELERRNRDLETSMADELRGLAARVAAAEEELARAERRRIAAEARADRAERRAAAATAWLERIRDHAVKHLPR